MKIEEIINNCEELDKEEKSYWLDILPTMDKFQQERLASIILKTEIYKLKEFNLEFMVNWEE